MPIWENADGEKRVTNINKTICFIKITLFRPKYRNYRFDSSLILSLVNSVGWGLRFCFAGDCNAPIVLVTEDDQELAGSN